MEAIIATIAGWIGIGLMLLAYFLLVKKKVKSNSKNYNMMNFVGGIGVLMNSTYNHAWPIAVLNVFWIGVAIMAMIKK